MEELKNNKKEQEKDIVAIWSFVLGIASIFLASIGIIPIFAIILGIIGLNRTKDKENSGRWMAVTGLILGILYTLVYMNIYGHI